MDIFDLKLLNSSVYFIAASEQNYAFLEAHQY